MKTHKAMKQFVHDLDVELRLSMAIPVGGYGTVEETPIITVPKVLVTWLWRYVDEWLEDESDKNKEKYLIELIKSVRDDQIDAEVDEEPEYDDEETADVDKGDDLGPVSDHPESELDDVNIEEEEEEKMCECQHCDCNNVTTSDDGLCGKCFEECDRPEEESNDE